MRITFLDYVPTAPIRFQSVGPCIGCGSGDGLTEKADHYVARRPECHELTYNATTEVFVGGSRSSLSDQCWATGWARTA